MHKAITSGSSSDFALLGLLFSLLWTLIGLLVAVLAEQVEEFAQDWLSLQGPFLLFIGIWLLLLIKSRKMETILRSLEVPRARRKRVEVIADYIIISFVTVVGTLSLVSLGFSRKGLLQAFMWLTALVICFLAGNSTLHAIKLLIMSNRLCKIRVKVFSYSPAETKGLRDLAVYATFYGSLLTIGYGFALLGTLIGNWTGDPSWISLVQLFWPLIYVPLCLAVLIYPHTTIHCLVCREKEHLLEQCQEQINTILTKPDPLTKEDIERSNGLADFFEKVSSTPNYVMDFGIATKTFIPVTFNVVTIFISRDSMIRWARSAAVSLVDML